MNIKKASEMREKYDSLPSKEELLMIKLNKESAKFIKEIESEIEEALNTIYDEDLKENEYRIIKFATEDILLNTEWDLNRIENNLIIKGYEVKIEYSVVPVTKDKEYELHIEIKW